MMASFGEAFARKARLFKLFRLRLNAAIQHLKFKIQHLSPLFAFQHLNLPSSNLRFKNPHFSASFVPFLKRYLILIMKKIIFSLLVFSCFLKPVAMIADEGMWLPMLLGEQVYADMVKR